MKNPIYLFVAFVFLASCTTTAAMMDYVQPGQNETDVRRLLGKPRGVVSKHDSSYYFYKFKNSAAAPVSGGSTKYYVLLKEGKVVEKGPRRILGF